MTRWTGQQPSDGSLTQRQLMEAYRRAQDRVIPVGLCQCGCGQPTRIAEQTDPRWGHVKGRPVRRERPRSLQGDRERARRNLLKYETRLSRTTSTPANGRAL